MGLFDWQDKTDGETEESTEHKWWIPDPPTALESDVHDHDCGKTPSCPRYGNLNEHGWW